MALDDINKLLPDSDTLSDQLFKLTQMFEEVSFFYVQKVAEQINVIGEMNPTSINRMNVMTSVNEDISEIKQRLAAAIKQSIGPLKKILKTALKENWETESFKRLLDNHPLDKEDQKQLVRMTEMIARQTIGTMQNLSNTTAIDSHYRKLVDRAVLGVTSGMGSYTETVRDGIAELGQAGMQIEYASGYHRRLDSAIMQNVTNAAKQISQQGADLCREKMETDAIELSAHASPAPDHAPVQGRVFLNEEFAKMQSGQDFQDIAGNQYEGFRRPIGEWNCMHIANPFDTEDSVRTYTDKDLQDMLDANDAGFTWNGKHYTMYQGRQLMRKIETQIRRQKDTALAARIAGDETLEQKCKDRIAALEKRYADLCSKSELPPQWERTVVEQYRTKRKRQSNPHVSGATIGKMAGESDTDELKWPDIPDSQKPISGKAFKVLRDSILECGFKQSYFKRFKGNDQLFISCITKAKEVAERFPNVFDGKNVTLLYDDNPTSPNDFASTDLDTLTITLPSYLFQSELALENNYKLQADEGLFVKGTDYKSILIHEMGHIVQQYYKIDPVTIAKKILNLNEDVELITYLNEHLSIYSTDGKKLGDEIMSEVFSDFFNNKRTCDFSSKFMVEIDTIISEQEGTG